MNKLIILPALLLPLAGLVFADVGPDDPEQRRRQLQQDLPLIEVLVQSGLDLAAPRALWSAPRIHQPGASAVGGNAESHRRARPRPGGGAGRQGAGRAGSGVAGNVSTASSRIPAEQPVSLELRMVGEQAERLGGQLQTEIERLPATEQEYLRSALDLVSRGQLEVQKAPKGKGLPRVSPK